MFRKMLLSSSVALLCLSAAPAWAGVPFVEDQAGDANGLGTWEEALHVGPLSGAPYLPGTPASYGPADLRKIWITTDYRTDYLKRGAEKHVATGITLHLTMQEPFRTEGPSLLYTFDIPTENCDSSFTFARGHGTPYSGTDDVWWSVDTACTPAPDDEDDPDTIKGVYRHPAWNASIAEEQVRIFIPFASLEPWQRAILAPGQKITGFAADTQADLLIYPFMDATSRTGEFVVGSDLPADKPPTKRPR